ncbi:MAG: DNA translocase FtsK, partial [Muribaculaceae bacterium]|nr:DNA translocase FtsK [Muribaculaceae bacterium]
MTSPFGAIGVTLAMVTLVILIFLKQLSAAYDSLSNYMAERRAKAERRKLADLSHLDEADGQPETADNNARREPDGQPSPYEPAADIDNEDSDNPIDPNDLFNLNESDEPAPEAEAADLQPEETSFEVIANEIEEADHVTTDAYDPTADLSRFHLPPLDLLIDRTDSKVTVDTEEQETNKQRIIDALAQFNIQIESIKATVGPTITLFEVVPAPGQRIAAIKRVEEDLALALKALGIRIIAPIPGRGTIGIEVPNSDPQVVSMRSIIGSKRFQECKYELPMALGATISNEVFIADLAKMPHLLVAGATGQGKSVGLNAIITSLLYKKHPAELKFVLIDPKMVEFSLYRTLEKHYLAKLPDEEDPVITDPAKVVATLNSLCVEMDNRYSLLSAAGCR